MHERDSAFAALRDAIDAFAIEKAPELVGEARAEAVSKAREMLSEAMLQSLLHHAGTELDANGGQRRARPDAQASRPREAIPEPDLSGRSRPQAHASDDRAY